MDPSPRAPAASLGDSELGSELQHAEELAKSGSPNRENEIEDEIEKRVVRTSFQTAPGSSPGTPGNTQVTADVAVQILENVASGKPVQTRARHGGRFVVRDRGQPVHRRTIYELAVED